MPGLAAKDLNAADRAFACGAGGSRAAIGGTSGSSGGLAGVVEQLGAALVAHSAGGPAGGLSC